MADPNIAPDPEQAYLDSIASGTGPVAPPPAPATAPAPASGSAATTPGRLPGGLNLFADPVATIMQRPSTQPLVDYRAGLEKRQADQKQQYLEAQKKEVDAVVAQQQAALSEAAERRAQTERLGGASRAEVDNYLKELKEKPLPSFVPTQTTATDIAGIFSLMGVIGMAMGGKGQMSALGAMNSMTGMMNGWRQGRMDLYAREKDAFEKQFQQVKAQRDEIRTDLTRAREKLAKYDIEGANAIIAETAAKNGMEVLKKVAEAKGAMAAVQFGMQLSNQVDQVNLKIIEQELAYDKAALESTKQLALEQMKRTWDIQNVLAGGGSQAVLARLTDNPILAANTDKKEAAAIVSKIGSIYRVNELLNLAKDPDIKFGEAGTIFQRVANAFQRNITDLFGGKDKEGDKISSATGSASYAEDLARRTARDSGLSENDKNILFYKKAIFTALEMEREARGGSILPVAVIKQLTPLLDPKSQTREGFGLIFMDRAKEIAGATGLTQEQLNKALRNYEATTAGWTPRLDNLGTPAAPAAPATTTPAASGPTKTGLRFNPETGDIE